MSRQLNIFLNLTEPKTHTQEVLFSLICHRQASIEMFRSLPGFRTRISELVLKYNLSLKSEFINKKNKFGKKFTYVNHILPEFEVEKAVQVYKNMTIKK